MKKNHDFGHCSSNAWRKTLRVMKLTTILFFLAIFTVAAEGYSQGTRISMKMEDASLKEVFRELKSLSDYTFVYSEGMVADVKIDEIDLQEVSVEDALTECLEGTDLEYYIENNVVVIRKKAIEFKQPIEQEKKIINGKVTDDSGSPIPGASIYIKGLQKPLGTITNIDGEFSLDLRGMEEATLIVSFIGMETQEIVVTSQEYINITLLSSTEGLDEVVVVGYGTQKRSEVSSAISTVSSEKLEDNIASNASFDRALGGLVKGVQVVQNAGAPGSGVDINIRGITSPFGGSDNNPLFVIDGVPFQTNPVGLATVSNPLLSINPNDIESIDVLKDASATAIYGSRGANGVIMIKTKKGRKGEDLKVSLSASTTFGEPINTLDYANTTEWKAFANDLFNESFKAFEKGQINSSALTRFGFMANFDTEPDPLPWDPTNTKIVGYNSLKEDYFGTANTNWADEIYRNKALTQQYNATLTGGTEKTNMLLSLSYTDQEGLIKEENFEQFNVRMGIDANVNDITSVGANITIGSSSNESGYASASTINANSVIPTLNARPDITPYKQDGTFNRYQSVDIFGQSTSVPNPVALLSSQDNNSTDFTALGNFYVEVRPIKDLKLKSELSASRFGNRTRNFDPAKSLTGVITDDGFGTITIPKSTLFDAHTVNTNKILNLTATYGRTFNDHSVSGMIGYSWDRSKAVSTNSFYQGFPDDKVLTDPKSAEEVVKTNSSEIEIGMNSIFARLTYSYDSRYYFTANFRTDKSVRFAPSKRRAYFPSASASWAISNEEFLSSSEVINNLRLRTGWGRTGSNNIPNFAYLQFFGINNGAGDVVYNQNQAVGLNGTLPNPEIKWELTEEVNLGVDFGLFNNRLRGSVDVYNRKSKDALMPSLYPLESGATSFTSNFADITNKGFEFEVGGDIIRNENLVWSASFNISKNKNSLDKFAATALNDNTRDRFEVGREINFINGYVTEGIIQNQAELDALNAGAPDNTYQEAGTGVGDYKFADLNNDGEVTSEDQTYLGSAQTDFFGGFNTNVAYKGFELSAYFNFSAGGESVVPNSLFPAPDKNIERRFLDRWTENNTNALYPRAILSDPNQNSRMSSAHVYSTSYIRLKNVQLKYNIPADVLSKIGVEKGHVFVAGNNLWTKTDFPGIDPELVGGFSSGGNTSNPYPLAKTWSVGVNLNF
ncbi:SusC/RagA family TonB-linked outer membrane protein [Marinifilum flexuosum]|uniref:TonB-linked SusC/RagA family outer membrane protein n=1 Tax=Marinifilum flexuosum TaxID=1117708 RepID=A0A419WWH2_9BACT|nr:SusC/RagA family TonB-linked outer membrane protein [Marinifilum flexuosum]RKD99776.1 TonB-linked SusC/RagA family outer membrane protein [Marinifilum flexuosum]